VIHVWSRLRRSITLRAIPAGKRPDPRSHNMDHGITPSRRSGLAVAVALASLASPARAQETIWRTYGDATNQHFSCGLDDFEDVDGDGVVDLLVGAGPIGSLYYKGFVRIVSGADGSTLSTVRGVNIGDAFGNSVATVGDLDLDGTADYVVGAPGVDYYGTDGGAVYAISGATGSTLYEIDGATAGDRLGLSVAALGDVDGDGFGDFAAGSNHSYALMISGSTGQSLAVLTGSMPSTNYAIVVAGGGDLDGDGVPDVAVGDLGSNLGSFVGGAVSLFSGATRNLIYEIGFPVSAACFGVVTFTEDVDADGTPDLFIGAPLDQLSSAGLGSAWVHSGRSGTFITGFVPGGAGATGWMMGVSVRSAGDTNNDGAVDWLIGAPGFAGSPAKDRGTVFLMSGLDGGLLYHFEEPPRTWNGIGYGILKPRDFDGDGVPDFPFTAPIASHKKLGDCGDVSIRKGHAFWVDASPRIVVASQPLTLSIGQAQAFNPFVLALRDVNGTPCFIPILVGFLDVAGRASLPGTVPPSFGQNTIDFQAITLDSSGKLLLSGIETLTTQ